MQERNGARTRYLLGMLIATASVPTLAADEMSVEDLILSRQANLRDLGGAFKEINDQLKKDKPSLELIRQYAAQIEDLSKQQDHWYTPGTGPESGVKTKAKAEIWTQPAEFENAKHALQTEASKFRQIAAGTDIDAIKTQRQVLGRTCAGCHDRFRTKED